MPAVPEDEDERVCLLSADQDLGPGSPVPHQQHDGEGDRVRECGEADREAKEDTHEDTSTEAEEVRWRNIPEDIAATKCPLNDKMTRRK